MASAGLPLKVTQHFFGVAYLKSGFESNCHAVAPTPKQGVYDQKPSNVLQRRETKFLLSNVDHLCQLSPQRIAQAAICFKCGQTLLHITVQSRYV